MRSLSPLSVLTCALALAFSGHSFAAEEEDRKQPSLETISSSLANPDLPPEQRNQLIGTLWDMAGEASSDESSEKWDAVIGVLGQQKASDLRNVDEETLNKVAQMAFSRMGDPVASPDGAETFPANEFISKIRLDKLNTRSLLALSDALADPHRLEKGGALEIVGRQARAIARANPVVGEFLYSHFSEYLRDSEIPEGIRAQAAVGVGKLGPNRPHHEEDVAAMQALAGSKDKGVRTGALAAMACINAEKCLLPRRATPPTRQVDLKNFRSIRPLRAASPPTADEILGIRSRPRPSPADVELGIGLPRRRRPNAAITRSTIEVDPPKPPRQSGVRLEPAQIIIRKRAPSPISRTKRSDAELGIISPRYRTPADKKLGINPAFPRQQRAPKPPPSPSPESK